MLEKYPDRVRCMNVENAWELVDADTPDTLRELCKEMRKGL